MSGNATQGTRVSGTGGGNIGSGPMRHLATTADRIDHWIRRRIVPDPCQSRVNSGRDRRVALAAIGRSLKDQYDALATPVPARLSALMEQLKIQA